MSTIFQALIANLAVAIGASDTSIAVRNLKDSRGRAITTMPSGGNICYATIEPRSNSNQEIISFTGLTDNGNGIVTLTGVTRNLNPLSPFTAMTADVPHSTNAELIVSNNPPFYSGFLQSDSNVTIIGSYLFPNPTNGSNPATKDYADNLAIAGAPDAGVSTRGIAMLTASPNLTIGTCTITIASPAVISFTAHGLQIGDSVQFTTSGALPTGIVASSNYYVISAGFGANSFQISGTLGGAAINTTGGQSGTHTLIRTTPYVLTPNEPRLPTTGEKAALAGAVGTPSDLNRYLTQDTVFSDSDQSQATQNSGVEFGEANATTKKNTINQSFVAGKNKIRGVKLYKTANTGTFTGTVTVELKRDSGGNPSATLATKTFTNAQWLTVPVGEFSAIFSAEYTSLVIGTTYWLSISSSTADNSNHPNLGINSAGGYANGSVKYWNTADSFVAMATIDLYFITLNGISSEIISSFTQVFLWSDTWVKPIGAKTVMVTLVGGGGGGGGAGNVNSTTGGGGGGGGGGVSQYTFNATSLGATVDVVAGAAGTGGAGKASGSTGAGIVGGNGGDSSFGAHIIAKGGTGGNPSLGSGSAGGTGGAGGFGNLVSGSNGGAGGSGGGAGVAGTGVTTFAPTGGGGGGSSGGAGSSVGAAGGARSVIAVLAGGTGGNATGSAGGAGNSYAANDSVGGTGGGGGGGDGSNNANGGNGGAGATYGAGGGGGGATFATARNSGNGGAGAAGIVIVTTYF